MRMIKVVMMFVVLLGFAVINADLVFSQDDQESENMAIDEELDQELKWLQAETYVITPSRIPEKIKKTASSITVVTDKQIRQMGAKDLSDVLQRVVPSFRVFRSVEALNLLTVRGPGTTYLMMINNLPLNSAATQGGYYLAEDTLSLDNVKRIEIIRGPGSTLHGANAYQSVINIITKKAEDVDGLEFSALGGSWDTQQYNLLFGKTFSDLEVVFNLNVFKTHGHSALIKEDWQTFEDRYFYTPNELPPISLAPGYTKEHEDKVDLAVNLEYKGFTFDGRYIDRETEEPLGYMNYRLTEGSTRSIEKFTLNLGYETSIREGLDFSAKAYRLYDNAVWDMQQSLPGSQALYPFYPDHYIFLYMYYLPPPSTVFDQGIFLKMDNKGSRTGMEIQTTYKMNDSNTIVAGATYERQKFYDDKRWANYLPDPPGVILLPSMQIWPEEYSFDDFKMNFKALFLEDVWDITQDLRLTLGGRYDDYSYFGSHFSPRAGLTWEYMKRYDLKLLYGHAFVVPGYIAITRARSGSIIDPQTIDTYEFSIGADITSSLEGRITFFRSEEKDKIEVGDDGFATNAETSPRSQGVEVEARYDFGRGTYITANFVFSSMREYDQPRAYIGKIMSNIRLSKYLNLYLDCFHLGGLSRVIDYDLRDSSSGHTIANATLIARKFLKGYDGLELRGSIYNLFDEDYASAVGLGWVPYGYPQPGINFLVEVEYRF